jgi:hypothetical protein
VKKMVETVRLPLVLALAACGAPGPALGWIYSEHRDITVLAVEKLAPERRAALAALWGEARAAHGQRLCEEAADAALGDQPSCIDWAALPAIAGDHSCSSKDMTETVLESRWILAVASVAAQLKNDLARVDVLSPSQQVPGSQPIENLRRRGEAESARAARVNALRTADNRLQRADPRYATRASSNNAHFLLPRPYTGVSISEYGALTVKEGAEINALGAYAWYHLSALQKATRLAREQLAPEVRQELARAMLFDEAFGLHFLEDAFAAGHVAGTWGDASQRKGTHDFYNQAGLEAFTWNTTGQSQVLMGDAHMRPEDADRAAAAVAASLEQVLDAAAGRPRAADLPHTPAAPAAPDVFDVCSNAPIPTRPEPRPEPQEPYVRAFRANLAEVLRGTPIPGLGPGLGSMPRFRSEVGPFIGLSGIIDGRFVDGGFTATSQRAGFQGGVDLALRAGLGLDGVIGEAGDGLVFLALGFRGDSPTTSSVADPVLAEAGGNLTAAIPSRTAVSTRVRMPFYLLPGDLILLAPVYLFSPSVYTDIAVVAANGGLIPWQSGTATRFGRFQLVLGREVGVTFYGVFGNDRVIAPPTAAGETARVVAYESVALDLPILEYRPYRSFDSSQSSTVLFVLFTSADFPRTSSVTAPAGAPDVDLRTVWSVGLRLVFDWRYYW